MNRLQAHFIRDVQRRARVAARVPISAGFHVDGGIAVASMLKAHGFDFDRVIDDYTGAMMEATATVFRSPIGGKDLDSTGRQRTQDIGGSPTTPGLNVANKDLREVPKDLFQKHAAELKEIHGAHAYRLEAQRRGTDNVPGIDMTVGADKRARSAVMGD